ncbi:hypothetical protein K490DRAFT_42478 [Saccharata proteae CBS 121410]|uniref:GST N-terminal domain-containing protein n=1 Tax=Saccharata proteae CBS 121410 TaxID=1314787 RepID=A0A9P4HW10_9PEZI|nr:hypothetical protein K490DRAFT_42478 [Saccharata proteae CBS 121410]
MPNKQQRTEIHQSGTADGWHGTIEAGGRFPPEGGRYHMYIGLFCPFAHRANLVRHLANLTSIIDISVVMPYPKGDENGWPGWRFLSAEEEKEGVYPGATADRLFGSKYLHEVYFKADKEYKGRYSVPVIWDKKTGEIVSNESAEILRWLPTAFTSITEKSLDLYPVSLQPKIDALSPLLQDYLNTGVYKAGFAPNQDLYNAAIPPLFGALNFLEKLIHANGGPYVFGDQLTEVDVRVYATIVRFDTVYVQHFKCDLGTIRHVYPVLNEWLKGMYWGVEGCRETTEFRHIKENYTKSHDFINPRGITPMGPFPEVEEGPAETQYSKLKPGGVKMDKVLEWEERVRREYEKKVSG